MRKANSALLYIGTISLLLFAAGDRYDIRMDTTIYSNAEAQSIVDQLARGGNPDWYFSWLGWGGLTLCVLGSLQLLRQPKRIRR